jgi:hypothetical protein
MVISIGFIVRRIWVTRGDLDLSVFADPRVLAALFAVALLEGIGIILASVNYRILVANISGVKVRWPLAVKVYTISNLYKYIPGGVMYVIGRNRMAIETDGLSHGKVAISTFVEGAFIAIAAVFVAAAFSFEHSLYYIRQSEILPVLGIIALAVLAAAVPVIYGFRRRLRGFFIDLKENTKDLRPVVFAKRLLFALVLMVLWAFTFLATLILLGQPMTFNLGITVMGLYMLSWLSGFLAPGAPSGLGVREMVMLMFMAGTLNEGILISAMVMHRLLTVVGDIFAYGMALGYERSGKIAGRVL